MRLQLETKPLRPALDDPNGRFYTRNVTARFSAELVKAVGQILDAGGNELFHDETCAEHLLMRLRG